MIQDYIEGKLTEQVTLLNALLDFQDIHLSQLATLVNARGKKVADTLKDLVLLYEDQLSWTIKGGQVQLETSILDNKLHYFYAIYQNSLFLQTLHFFLDPKQKDFSDFSQSQFVSTATAYRLKKKCLNFLKEVGLTIRHNQIAGPEHRMRFLIVLLHYRYGFPIYEFAKKDLDLVKDIIVTSNKALNLAILENTPEEYQFFSYLVILSWYRHDYPLSDFCDHNLEHLKSIFIFDRVSTICSRVLEPKLGIQFSEREREYLFLAYCTTNNALYKDQWLVSDKKEMLQIVRLDTDIKYLLPHCEALFGSQISTSNSFTVACMFLMQNYLCGMQGLLPEGFFGHYHLDEEDHILLSIVTHLLDNWLKVLGIEEHNNTVACYLLTIHLRELIKLHLEPVPVYVFANNIADLSLLQTYLKLNFPTSVADIYGINILTSPCLESLNQKKGIILSDLRNRDYLKNLYQQQDHHFINFSMSFHALSQTVIAETIAKLRQENYQTFLNQLYSTLQ